MNGREEGLRTSRVKRRTALPSSTSMRKPQVSETWGKLEECTMRKNEEKEKEARGLMGSGTDRQRRMDDKHVREEIQSRYGQGEARYRVLETGR